MLNRPFSMYLIGHTVLERLVWSIMIINPNFEFFQPKVPSLTAAHASTVRITSTSMGLMARTNPLPLNPTVKTPWYAFPPDRRISVTLTDSTVIPDDPFTSWLSATMILLSLLKSQLLLKLPRLISWLVCSSCDGCIYIKRSWGRRTYGLMEMAGTV